ncbi:MAG: diguanylate cyclase, partial [Ruminiclostridium sp.]|nr:diguanylate cyclase [Ruminiclostridium sp.]
FDINNLKTINDNLGHEQGDKLIKDGSAIIYKVFGKIGNVYRTGGDEFVGIIYGDDAMTLCYNAIAAFNMAIDEYNSDESHKFILQIAYGSEYYNSDSDRRYMTLKEIQKQADANMYSKKQRMKKTISKEQILKREPLNTDNI